MIARQGLVEYNNNEADLARFCRRSYRLYRRRFTGGCPQIPSLSARYTRLRDPAVARDLRQQASAPMD